MTTHSKTYKMNPEYREAVASQLAKIKRTERQNALRSIPKGWRFVMETDEFCSDDKVWGSFGSDWYQTVNSRGAYSLNMPYITSRPLVQNSAQETFADYKAEAEALGLEVRVEHERKYCVTGYISFDPKGGKTTVSLITKSGELVGLGYAYCSPSDNYCKEKGRLLAIKRAIADMKEREQTSKEVEQTSKEVQEQTSHSISDSAGFRVGDYVNWKVPGGSIVHGPHIIVELPQEGVIVTDPRWCGNILDVCRDKVWLAGTPEPGREIEISL